MKKKIKRGYGANRIFLEYDKDSFTTDGFYIDISLQRCFGVGVRKIADVCGTDALFRTGGEEDCR